MAICNPTETNSSRQQLTQQKNIQETLLFKTFPNPQYSYNTYNWRQENSGDAAIIWVAIQFSSLVREGKKKHGQEKQTRLSTYNLLGDAADDPIPKIPLNLKIIHCPHNWRALKFPLRRIPKLAPVLLLPQIFSTPENSSDFFTVTQLEWYILLQKEKYSHTHRA